MSARQASFASALPLITLQLGSRLFSFILNQALLRIATPSAFGTATIQFELLLNTILFLSREGVRVALLRTTSTTKSRVNNVSFIPFILGCPVALGTSYLYVAYAGEETSAQPYFREAVYLYVLGALIELMKEPIHNVIMTGLNTKIRLRAEGSAVVGKTLVTFLAMYYDPHKDSPTQHRALVAFALGQLFFSVCVLAIYVYHFGLSYLIPTYPEPTADGKGQPFFDPDLLKLSATVTSQSLVKHFLSEGDKFIISWFSPLENQGGYAIALNYGSLIARIILQPLEETSRSLFSQLLSQPSDPSDPSPDLPLAAASSRLTALLAIQLPISLLLPIFGPPYIPLAARILLPRQYQATSAPQVLSAWLYYIPFLALNGQLEAFMASGADTSDLNRQSTWMAVFSVVYTGAAALAYRVGLGDASLVYANVLNLGARIVYTAVWISGYFARKGRPGMFAWRAVLPSAGSFAVLVFCGVVLRWQAGLEAADVGKHNGSRLGFSVKEIQHVAVGGLLGLFALWQTTRSARRRISRSKVE